MNKLGRRRGAVGWGKNHFYFARLGGDVVLGAVLVPIGVASDDNGLSPALDEARNVFDDDGLAEDSSVENVADGAVGRLPHLLEVELFDAALVGGDGGALDADLVLLHGVGGVNGDLVVGCITVLHAQIVVFCLQVDVGVDVLHACQ